LEFVIEVKPRQRALADYVLCRVDKLKEEDMSCSSLAQEVFLLKHKQELSSLVEARIVPKILQDIDMILEEGCAMEISERDFDHVHLCSLSPIPIFDLDALLSEENVGLLYHTCEKWFSMPHMAKRNTKSTLLTRAEILPIPYQKFVNNYGGESHCFSKISVYSSELGWSEWGRIMFEQDPGGSHQLRSGPKLKMTGTLSPVILSHMKVEDETIKVDGQLVGMCERV
jgi:hypothetical protein